MKIPIDVILGEEEVRLNLYMTFIHNFGSLSLISWNDTFQQLAGAL